MLTGAEGMFSSGYDIGDIPDDVFAVEAEKLVAHPFTAALDALEATDLPTVAALPGHTIGGGLELALCCDLRVAADGIRLGMPPAKLGLVYSHVGLRRFVDAVGAPRTRELFLLGRNVDARVAETWGLVNRVVPDDELDAAVTDLMSRATRGSRASKAWGKQTMYAQLDRPERDAYTTAVEVMAAASQLAGAREGMSAFLEKRSPVWPD